MSPETFTQIVGYQQRNLLTGPGEPLVIGGTETGEQVAVLEGRSDDDELPHYVVVTATSCELEDNDFRIEKMWVGAKNVRHPTINPHTGNRTIITLPDGRVLGMPRNPEQAATEADLARLGGLAIRPVTAIFDYRQKLPVDAV
jgi:hypothetical protein